MNELKGVLLYKLPVKIVALLAACVLWVIVMSDQNPSMEGGFSVKSGNGLLMPMKAISEQKTIISVLF